MEDSTKVGRRNKAKRRASASGASKAKATLDMDAPGFLSFSEEKEKAPPPSKKDPPKNEAAKRASTKQDPPKKKRKPLTDEQRAAKNAKDRQRYWDNPLTDEQRAAKNAKTRQRRNGAAKLQGKTATRWEPSEEEDFHSQINEFLDAEKDLSTKALVDLIAWRNCEVVRDLEGIDKNLTKYAEGSSRLRALAKRRLYNRQLLNGWIPEAPEEKRTKSYLTKGEEDVLNTAGKLTRGFMRCGGTHSDAVWVTLEHAYHVNNMDTQEDREKAARDAWPPGDPNAIPAELNFDRSFAKFQSECDKNNRQYPEDLRHPQNPTGLARQLLAGAMEFYRHFRSRKYPHAIICGLEPSRRQWKGADIPHVSFLFIMEKGNDRPWKKEMVAFLREWGLRFKNDSLFDPQAVHPKADETANEPDKDETDGDCDSDSEAKKIMML